MDKRQLIPELMGVRVSETEEGEEFWETPDGSCWRLVGGEQLQRWHAEALPRPAWIAYHASVQFNMARAVAWSMGYSHREMLRVAPLDARPSDGPLAGSSCEEGEDPDRPPILIAASGPILDAVREMMEGFPEMPMPGKVAAGLAGAELEVLECLWKHTILLTAMGLAVVLGQQRVRTLATSLMERANRQGPGADGSILPFPEGGAHGG